MRKNAEKLKNGRRPGIELIQRKITKQHPAQFHKSR